MEESGQLNFPAVLPRGKSPRCPSDRRLVGFRTGLDCTKKVKLSRPYRESNHCLAIPDVKCGDQLAIVAEMRIYVGCFRSRLAARAMTFNVE
jgi:hypothetical protein